ncbi:glycerophosphodiester phosphodiesterase family protein [Carboxylicivirga marina]|uniref:Glycerophosphodiester phosphodiesterase family protein n=1 Tax=Carboxylicivirga marina TaxID=2800988 RepID=A0ABS1HP56_9BACT|nr:glycerophosphodiester phosphodiesterase family protein [Carboxylicivirga marina]MBK3519473.1 glycerophosphodiester phosphodiesterase family protein [Carboxylicivirga marina]
MFRAFLKTPKSLIWSTLYRTLKNSKSKDIIVVAHRGDWRNAPENSLQAIQYCIDMGVDMVEIDVRETKDGQLVLMHDNTIDRTTKKKGKVKDYTLEELKTFHLVDGLGMKTPHKIPSLEEALLLAKGKILINIDKGYPVFEKCYKVMEQTNTLNNVIMKGKKTRADVEKEYGQYLDKVYFMPQIKLPNPNAKVIVDDYLEKDPPIAFAFGVPQDTIQFIQYFDDIRDKGSSVWVNSLWERHNGGHDDEKAALDPTVYDWYIKNNINIIQTDRPQLLLDYLRTKGLHK